MFKYCFGIFFFILSIISLTKAAGPDSVDPASAMRWRQIGPPRAGRARAAAGNANQPNVFYIGFDDGGVWRSTDYGSNWEPLFDGQSTGSIGAIAVAPSDPKVIYVGSGAGIIRPDLAVGDGVYKSTDGGKSWTHLGLSDTQMIAMMDVDPRNPNRVFVAALGHPYGPNSERGVFRSIDGGRTFQKVLYKDEYTSANDVRIDPSDPNIVYAALWQQQQAFYEGGGFAGTSGGIFKSTDGGTSWKQLTEGLPQVMQANLAPALSNPKTIYAVVSSPQPNTARAPQQVNVAAGPVGLYKSNDGGEHWFLAVRGPDGTGTRTADPRPLGRIGGGDLPTFTVDPKDPNTIYSCSTVMWRSEDGGLTWSAVRGAPGGDDYQRVWINPSNPDILLLVSDQGGVVSGNRGASWSNWYTQPTAAMYHVTTDNAFPYRVCGGQQDSGSACVDSRSNDGEITFHDWHPVNIQEYGEAAPDPKNPDLVYGSGRTNVSLYNRKTGQTKQVGPNLAAADAKGQTFTRNVRTMPLEWSPFDPNVLFYGSNAVWKTIDGGGHWSRISGDLTRQSWTTPKNAGKYAGDVTPSPLGAITALSPSPLNVNIIWAGADDGQIQSTTDAGLHWNNVTPPQIDAWTRIFNIEAGHFDANTVYAAANTLRIDDSKPHFWRSHDGGKTWTEINNGISPDAVSNSIREDPRQRGLLYAATNTQVWVSFDDGDHWQSLRLNMPAISVRDLQVKDDNSCLCADLVAGTHGRGFWILDDLTPLRQAARIREAQTAGNAYLVRPLTAVRVRFGMNDPTPWPPELPAGENPPPGGIIDYYLAADAKSPVKVEILDAAGGMVRTYSSDDPVRSPHPALNPEAYNRMCQQTPNAADCGLPLYWPAPPMIVSTREGMHRMSWDLHYQPLGEGGQGGGGGGGIGAVPHLTYPAVNAPWAPPGSYTLKISVDGKTYTQPLTLRFDPRVKTLPADLATLASLSKEMYEGARAARTAFDQARRLVAQLDGLQGSDVDAFKQQVDALAPAPAAGGGRGGRGGGGGGGGQRGARGGRGGAPAATLDSVSTSMMAAAMAMQAADMAPTGREINACADARRDSALVMSRWTKLKTVDLEAFNAKRKAAGLAPIAVP
jgi:photosystem II stability/assembly factor-like uncharacterized protein